MIPSDWRLQLQPGDRIRYSPDGLVYVPGTIQELDYYGDGETPTMAWIRFTNGQEIDVFLIDIFPCEE